jgi:ATP-dependent protease HslVU (ClpYQ) peptidase subunit
MTTIAAIQGDDFAVVAFDSMVSEGGEKVFILPRSLPKVVKVNDSILGAAGDLRAVNLISTFELSIPEPELRGRELDMWFGQTFVPDLKELFEDSGYEKENEHESTIIAVMNCTIFEVGTSYEWLRDDRGVYSIGSGSPYAMGYLRGLGSGVLKDFVAARDAVVRAVELAVEMDPMTGGPVYVEYLKRT